LARARPFGGSDWTSLDTAAFVLAHSSWYVAPHIAGTLIMTNLLLLGAGFSHNWGAPLAKAINGSLLRDLHDDPVLERALREQPFENALADFFKAGNGGDQRHQRLQAAVTALFDRINQSLRKRPFEFSNDRANSVKDFLERFDAIFTLNQDLLFEIAYLPRFISLKWTAAEVPGMQASYEQGRPTLDDPTRLTWRPNGQRTVRKRVQPFFKLHGSSNWKQEAGDTVMIMGSAKASAIARFPVLQWYHEEFRARLNQPGTKLMVVGYSFLDEHINQAILDAYRAHGLQTHIVDPRGKDVLQPPGIEGAPIKWRRDIQDIKLIGEAVTPLSTVFGGDIFARVELMRFFE
jgi:hypothetical protein